MIEHPPRPPHPQPKLRSNSQPKQQKQRTKAKMFSFFQRMGFLLRIAHTQHTFTQGQCCVLAILDPLLQFWTSDWVRVCNVGN